MPEIPANIKHSVRLLKDAAPGVVLGWALRIVEKADQEHVATGLVVMELDQVPSRKTELRQFRREPRWKTLQRTLVATGDQVASECFGVYIRTDKGGVFAVGDPGGKDLKTLRDSLKGAARDQAKVNLGKPRVVKWNAAKALLTGKAPVDDKAAKELFGADAFDGEFTAEDARELLGEMKKVIGRISGALQDMDDARGALTKLDSSLPQEQVGEEAPKDLTVYDVTTSPEVNTTLKDVLFGRSRAALGKKQVMAFLKQTAAADLMLSVMGIASPTPQAALYDAFASLVAARVQAEIVDTGKQDTLDAWLRERLMEAHLSLLAGGDVDKGKRCRAFADLAATFSKALHARLDGWIAANHTKPAEPVLKELADLKAKVTVGDPDTIVRKKLDSFMAFLGRVISPTTKVADLFDKNTVDSEAFDKAMARAPSVFDSNGDQIDGFVKQALDDYLQGYRDYLASRRDREQLFTDLDEDTKKGARRFDQSAWALKGQAPLLDQISLPGVCHGLCYWMAGQDPTKPLGEPDVTGGVSPLVIPERATRTIVTTQALHVVAPEGDLPEEERIELVKTLSDCDVELRRLRANDPNDPGDPDRLTALLATLKPGKLLRLAHQQAARVRGDKVTQLKAEIEAIDNVRRRLDYGIEVPEHSPHHGKTDEQLEKALVPLKERRDLLVRRTFEEERFMAMGLHLVTTPERPEKAITATTLASVLAEECAGLGDVAAENAICSMMISLLGAKSGHVVMVRWAQMVPDIETDHLPLTFFDPNVGTFPFKDFAAFLAWAPKWFTKVYSRSGYTQVSVAFTRAPPPPPKPKSEPEPEVVLVGGLPPPVFDDEEDEEELDDSGFDQPAPPLLPIDAPIEVQVQPLAPGGLPKLMVWDDDEDPGIDESEDPQPEPDPVEVVVAPKPKKSVAPEPAPVDWPKEGPKLRQALKELYGRFIPSTWDTFKAQENPTRIRAFLAANGRRNESLLRCAWRHRELRGFCVQLADAGYFDASK